MRCLWITGLVAVAGASGAFGDAAIWYSAVSLGEGLNGFNFVVYADDGDGGASFFVSATFEGINAGQIRQMPYRTWIDPPGLWFEAHIDTEAHANVFDGQGVPPYDKVRDSWFGDPFTTCGSVQSLEEADNYYHIESGTHPGCGGEAADLAYICCSGDVEFGGIISRKGVSYPFAGVALAPVLPAIHESVAYLGDGLYSYGFAILGNSWAGGQFGAEMTFHGEGGAVIHQLRPFGGIDVDSNEQAMLYHGMGGYDRYRDSYFIEPFASSASDIQEGENSYGIEGSTSEPGCDVALLAYIVTDGNVCFEGVITLVGTSFNVPVSGCALAPIPGDATRDGLVSGADYTIWADHYGMMGLGWDEGNFNGDGIVNGADYTIWADFYGTGSGAPVPEPGTLMLLSLPVLAVTARRRDVV